MGKRSTSRRLAMQAVYQAEVSNISAKEALENLKESEVFIPETVQFAQELALSAWEHKDKIAQTISKYAIDWSLERIGWVDRAILVIAIEEIEQGVTPSSVVINEAVELAKKYSTIEAAKFINGILGAYLRDRA